MFLLASPRTKPRCVIYQRFARTITLFTSPSFPVLVLIPNTVRSALKRCSSRTLIVGAIDLALANGGLYRLHRLQYKLWSELELILLQEELFWYQRARSNWINTIVRRRRNYISALNNVAGCWVTDSTELEKMVVDYFSDLYTLAASDSTSCPLPLGGISEICNSDLLGLVSPMDDEEIWKFVRRMGAYKAPGIDGFHPVFYHSCWPTIRESVCTFIREFFASGSLSSMVNETLRLK
ncbi:hypothetical protein V2J09_011475 [Rumex salicifolius]